MITDDMYNVWYNTYDPNFIEISKKSFVPDKWLRYSPLHKDDILKPINTYVEALYPAPKLIEIINNTVRLRQYSHADFYLLREKDESFYNIDRPWMRQYYQSREPQEASEDCFEGVYKFYTPWMLDYSIDFRFEEPGEESPFKLYPNNNSFYKIASDATYVEPRFVAFSFKNVGSHMKIDNKFGKIKRLSPMYDIVFDADDIIIQKVKEFYERS